MVSFVALPAATTTVRSEAEQTTPRTIVSVTEKPLGTTHRPLTGTEATTPTAVEEGVQTTASTLKHPASRTTTPPSPPLAEQTTTLSSKI